MVRWKADLSETKLVLKMAYMRDALKAKKKE